jgi:hypothetical protein
MAVATQARAATKEAESMLSQDIGVAAATGDAARHFQ